MEIEIIRYNETLRQPWNEFIRKSKNGLFFFDRKYLDYHADRFADHSFLFLRKGQIIALLPANASEKKLISHGGLTFGSLVMSFSLKAADVLDIFELLLKTLKEDGFEKFVYKPIPYIFSDYTAQEDLYALYRNNAKLIRRDISSVIELEKKIHFSETKRQLVAKCEKKGVELVENENFEEFWSLLETVLLKFNTKPVHTLAEIAYLKSNFGSQIRLFEAKLEGELLAGIVIFDFGKVIHTQYMASSQEGRKLGALDFINQFLINKFLAEKKYYSFGISTEQNGMVLNEGLIMQKENMGGRGLTIDFYEIAL